MRIIFFISLWFVTINVCAKDKLLVVYNLDDCDACNAFVNNLEAIDTSNVNVTFVFMERYVNDKEDLVYMLGLKKVKVDYVFNDSLYYTYLNKGSSTYIFNYNGRDFYSNYVKNGLQADIINNINNLYSDKTVYNQNMVPLSNTINSLTQYGHEIYYIHPLRNTINKFSLLESVNGQTVEILKFDKELISKAYRKIFNATAYQIQNDYLSKNNLEMNAKLISFSRDSMGNLWVASNHQVLLYSEEYKDTVLTNISGLYKFDLNLNYLDFYPIHAMKDVDSLKFQFKPVDYLASIFNFFIDGDELVSNVSKLYKSSGLPNYYYGRTSLNTIGELVVMKETLPDNYKNVGYNFHNIMISNDYRFYTLHLDDVIYSFDAPPIQLNLFKTPPPSMEKRPFPNSISTPVYSNGKIYFTYKSEGNHQIAVYNLANNKLESTKDVASIPEILNCNKWAFFDTSNPNYYLLINENGYLQRMSIK